MSAPDDTRVVGPAEVTEGPVGFIQNWLRILLGLLWVGFCSTVFLVVLLVCLPSRATRIKVGNVYGTFAGKGAAWLTGSRILIKGESLVEDAPPSIYLSNHASMLDIFLGIWMSRIGTCGVAKKQIIYYPFFGQFYWLAGHLTIDRTDNAGAVRALTQLVEFVRRHGLSIWIWPEGTRSRDGRLLPFKRGPFHLALATGMPIVPIVLRGTHSAWPNHTLRLFRTTVEVEHLPPIDTRHWTKETLDQHIEEVRRIYIAALPEDQRPATES